MKAILLLVIVFTAFSLVFYQFSEKILDWIRFQSVGTRDFVHKKLEMMMIQISPEKVFFYMAGVALTCGIFGFVLMLPEFAPAAVLAFIFAIVGWYIPKIVVNIMHRKRCEKFIVQMIDGLSLMSNGIRSGLSVVQSMSLVANEMPAPMKEEFAKMLEQNKLGMSVEESFTDLSRRITSDEVEMFVTSVNILKVTGGNLAETFDTISTTIRERVKLDQKIQAMMAQNKFQGFMLLCFPPAMVIMLKGNEPAMFEALITTPIGWGVLLGVLGLEVLAYFLISKITKIEV